MATTPSKEELLALKAMSRPSNRHGLLHLTGHLAAAMLSGYLLWVLRETWWTLAPAMLLHGVLLIFLFAPLHECVHATAFRSRWLNTAVGWIAGFLLLLPPTYFRAFHLAHHRHTQDPARDPELRQGKPSTLGAYLWHISGVPYWTDQVRTILMHAAGQVSSDFIARRNYRAVILEARVFLAGYAAIAGASLVFATWAPITFWLAPVVLGQPFLRLYLLAEHTGCSETPDMFENTRTTLTTPLVRALAWNMPYHAEHHVWPAVPFHALPRAHELLRTHLSVLDQGYLRVETEILCELLRNGKARVRAPN